jgi:hypothetical protein
LGRKSSFPFLCLHYKISRAEEKRQSSNAEWMHSLNRVFLQKVMSRREKGPALEKKQWLVGTWKKGRTAWKTREQSKDLRQKSSFM